MGDIDACTDFKMLEVKVPIIFLSTVGFSLPREGRYGIKSNLMPYVAISCREDCRPADSVQ